MKNRKKRNSSNSNNNLNKSTINSAISTNNNHDIKKLPIKIGNHHDAPVYLRDNEYIKSGYRINFNSKTKILKRY